MPIKILLKSTLFFGFMLLLGLFFSCGEDKYIPDVSGIEVPVKIRHFDRDLFRIDTNNVAEGLKNLRLKYPEFAPIFSQIIGADNPQYATEGEVKYMEGFLKHVAPRKLYDTCQVVYGNFEEMTAEFESAFRFYKYYFPEKPTPDVTTFVSEYVLANFIYGEDQLAIGLDMFLGADYPYKTYNPGNSNFSDYLTHTYNRDYLVAKTMNALVEDLVDSPRGQRLLDQMVHNGKKRFILSKLLPHAADSVIFGHTAQQMQWLKNPDNEAQIWTIFVDKEFLYSAKMRDIAKYITPAPTSPGMPPESPGNTGTYIGYKIVEKYMQRFPDTSLSDLIGLRDAQKILTGSRYKPRR